jgi:hypothetical protein
LLQKIVRAIESLQNPLKRAEVKIDITKQFNLIYQPDRALPYIEQVLQEIGLIAIDENFFINKLKCKAAEQLAKAGLQNRSVVMLTEALQYADVFEDPENRDYALIDVSEAYAEIGLYDRAIQIGLMIEDNYERVWRLFDSIAHTAIVQHSHHEQILNILAVIDDSQDRDHFLLEVANKYSAVNQLDRAIALVPLMVYPNSKTEALVEAVKGCSETLTLDQRLDFLNQAEAYALSEQDMSMKAQALRMIAEQHIELKQFTQAHILLEQAQQFAVSLSAADLLEQIPRDAILDGIARAFGKLGEYEAATQTTDSMTDRMSSASVLSNITQQESNQEAPDDVVRTKTMQELSAVESALTGDDSHLADLRRVQLAKTWSTLKLFERTQAIAEQISDPNLKALALRYAGIGIDESQYNRYDRLSAACESASNQSDFGEGIKLLTSVLEQVSSLDENYRCSFLIRVVDAYFRLSRRLVL